MIMIDAIIIVAYSKKAQWLAVFCGREWEGVNPLTAPALFFPLTDTPSMYTIALGQPSRVVATRELIQMQASRKSEEMPNLARILSLFPTNVTLGDDVGHRLDSKAHFIASRSNPDRQPYQTEGSLGGVGCGSTEPVRKTGKPLQSTDRRENRIRTVFTFFDATCAR